MSLLKEKISCGVCGPLLLRGRWTRGEMKRKGTSEEGREREKGGENTHTTHTQQGYCRAHSITHTHTTQSTRENRHTLSDNSASVMPQSSFVHFVRGPFVFFVFPSFHLIPLSFKLPQVNSTLKQGTHTLVAIWTVNKSVLNRGTRCVQCCVCCCCCVLLCHTYINFTSHQWSADAPRTSLTPPPMWWVCMCVCVWVWCGI